MNILIIEDDLLLSRKLKEVFHKKVILNRIKLLHSYEDFVRELPVIDSYDIIITDILLWENSEKTGIDIVNTIRKKEINIPVVVISCFGEITWLEKAFETWASDYIIKPFRLQELEIRILKWFKMYFCSLRFGEDSSIDYKGLVYNIRNNKFSYHDTILELTKRSKYILSIFLSRPEIVIGEDFFVKKLWWDILHIIERNFRVNILRLKKELHIYGLDTWIHNVRWEGYMLQSPKD